MSDEARRDDADIPPCLACGACCHGPDGWVHLDASDDARVEESTVLRSLVVVTDRGGMRTHSLRMVNGACGALRIADGETRCMAYEHRPQVCRDLERGSEACRTATEERRRTISSGARSHGA